MLALLSCLVLLSPWQLAASAALQTDDSIRLQLAVRETSDQPGSLPVDVDNLANRLAQLHRLPVWPKIVYSLSVRRPRQASRILAVERFTGQLRVVSPLRRELICPPSLSTINCSAGAAADSPCQISGLVQLRNQDNPAELLIVELLIDVLDIDNSAPQFERTILTEIDIWENSPIGHVIPLPRAFDLDQGGYATCNLIYSRTACSSDDSTTSNAEDDGTFVLTRKPSNSSTFGPPEYQLRLNKRLDKESVSRYRYCIAAAPTSHGSEGRTATATLLIRVQDYNDNAPVWSPSQVFVVNVSESNPPALLLKLSATDADSDFGLVHYRLLRDDPLFAVNSIGELTLRHLNGLDYETAEQHLLVVAAIDNGKPALSTTATITINVLDANDNRPRISLDHKYISLVENNAVPLYIHTLDVSDRDPGLNGQVACQIGPVELREIFYLKLMLDKRDSKIYTLNANRSFDRELISQYTVIIECSDAGSPPLSSAASVYISVTDENDNPPAFPVSPIDISFPESVARDSKVYDLRVIDPDLDQHGSTKQREFKLSGEGADHFRIAYQGGYSGHGGSFQYALTTTNTFDRETKDHYRFNITVIDWIDKPTSMPAKKQQDGPPKYHQATVEVSVKIIDVNDCPPEFNHTGPLIFEVFENATVGTVIGSVFATDKDLGDNGRLVYSLAVPTPLPYFYTQHQQKQLQELQRLFRVDAKNGEISLRGRLDLEGPSGLSQHNLDILATDLGTPRLSSSASVVVRVLDCNDNRPRFQSTAPISVNVSCDESVENHILPIPNKDLEAVDADVSEAFKQRRYRLAGVSTLARRLSLTSQQQRQQEEQQQQWHSFAVDENTGQVFVKSAPRLCQFARYKLSLEVFEPAYPREVSRKPILVNFEGGSRRPGGPERQPGDQPATKPLENTADESSRRSDSARNRDRFNGNQALRSSDTEGIVIAALVVASVILAGVLILAVVLLRKKLRKDAGSAAAAASTEAARNSTFSASTGTYMKGGRILLMPKATGSGMQHQHSQLVRRQSNDDSLTIDDNQDEADFSDARRQIRHLTPGSCHTVRRDGKTADSAVGLNASPSMDAIVLGRHQPGRLAGLGESRYGNCAATVAAEQQKPLQSFQQNDLSFESDDCRMHGGTQLGTRRFPAQQQQLQHHQHTYQTVLPAAATQQQGAASAEVQNAYMTFRYPAAATGGGAAQNKLMIDSKRRPSQPAGAAVTGAEGKSPYFTVSFV